MNNLIQMTHGALTTMSWVAALFFFRYWQISRDRLFVFFALSFTVLGCHWLSLALFSVSDADRYLAFLPRLLAFVLILIGVLDKNKRGK